MSAGSVVSWGPNNVPVPYAAAWSAERPAVKGLTVRADGAGLAYVNETPLDRDRHGVLWARHREAPGEGRPEFRTMHSVRQRRAMFGMLCQVCGGPADRTSRGWLFLLQDPGPAGRPADWPEGALCTKPPVCRPCASLAARHCPHLTAPVAVRSRKPRVWGVFGGRRGWGGRSRRRRARNGACGSGRRPGRGGGGRGGARGERRGGSEGGRGGGASPADGRRLTSTPEDEHLPYGHPATPWFLASQLVLELTRCTRVEIDTSPSAAPRW